jgi:hypothetical protein
MVFLSLLQYKNAIDTAINIYIICINEDVSMQMKQWRCVITLADGWKTETYVYALDHITAMKLAEAQTGGKCNAAFPMS